ncbi:hypothetical protein [Paraburkholderia sp. GAS334]|uniref:hypothetical protein n=1 Tax=Paraburkholderia sp. GAS334 TaxID=3035131 RepID=UPI003D1F653B
MQASVSDKLRSVTDLSDKQKERFICPLTGPISNQPLPGAILSTSMKRVVLAILCLSSASTFAASPILLETPVTYAPEASVVEQVKTECKIENMLTDHVGGVLSKLNKTGDGTIASQSEANGAEILRLQITHVLGVGGGAWSGPKAITVTADLVEDGNVVRHTKINRWSMGGFFGGFKGTCSILDRSAVAISKDLSRWVRDPSYEIKEEAPPKEASAPTAQTEPAKAE